MNVIIQATSSEGEPYHVEFTVSDGKLKVVCNCRAGMFGKHCKHKAELLAGDMARLHDPAQAGDLRRVLDVVTRAKGLHENAALISESEKIIRAEQARTKNLKDQLAQQLKEGIPIES